jgi:FixJ family two-component response regulator
MELPMTLPLSIGRKLTSLSVHTHPAVFVVDDDASVRESLAAMLRIAGFRVETFASAQAFLVKCPRATAPNCLVLDADLPDLSGLELQSTIASERADMPIIFITDYSDVLIAVQAMKAGAVEFLAKPLKKEVLLDAIRQAIERSRMIREEKADLHVLQERYSLLSPRQREVMALIASGLMNKQVGGELGISDITVKAHRGQVMRKMNARSLAELVTMAARLCLATAPRASSFGMERDRTTVASA